MQTIKRVRPHVTWNEAHCNCGCGAGASDFILDLADEFIEEHGRPVRINSIMRCRKYNTAIGGADDSGHLLSDSPFKHGAIDFRCASGPERYQMLQIMMAWMFLDKINQIEVCNRHLHMAKLPVGHRLVGQINWGRSK